MNANVNTSIETKTVKMFANFERNIFLPMTGEMEKADTIYSKLKDMGAAIGRHSINALIEGKELIVRGFEVVTVPDHHVIAAVAKKPDTSGTVGRMTKHGYVAAGPVLAVRKGSKIAIGLEKLKDGCTLEELQLALGHNGDESVSSFLNYRPKKRGYGIRFDDATKKYHLVMKEGQTEIIYK